MFSQLHDGHRRSDIGQAAHQLEAAVGVHRADRPYFLLVLAPDVPLVNRPGGIRLGRGAAVGLVGRCGGRIGWANDRRGRNESLIIAGGRPVGHLGRYIGVRGGGVCLVGRCDIGLGLGRRDDLALRLIGIGDSGRCRLLAGQRLILTQCIQPAPTDNGDQQD